MELAELVTASTETWMVRQYGRNCVRNMSDKYGFDYGDALDHMDLNETMEEKRGDMGEILNHVIDTCTWSEGLEYAMAAMGMRCAEALACKYNFDVTTAPCYLSVDDYDPRRANATSETELWMVRQFGRDIVGVLSEDFGFDYEVTLDHMDLTKTEEEKKRDIDGLLEVSIASKTMTNEFQIMAALMGRRCVEILARKYGFDEKKALRHTNLDDDQEWGKHCRFLMHLLK